MIKINFQRIIYKNKKNYCKLEFLLTFSKDLLLLFLIFFQT